jgi:hypothetical protein
MVTVTRGVEQRETVQVETRSEPTKVFLDPGTRSHDWNMLNNQHVFGFVPTSLLLIPPNRPTSHYLDGYFTRRSARDRLMMGWAPTAWFNDAGGWTFGARSRGDYLGRFALDEVYVSGATGWGVTDPSRAIDARAIVRNPIALRAPGLSTRFDVGWVEGRFQAQVGFEKASSRLLRDPRPLTWGMSLTWLKTRDMSYLDPTVYDDVHHFRRRMGPDGRWRPDRWLRRGGRSGYHHAGVRAGIPHRHRAPATRGPDLVGSPRLRRHHAGQ